MEKNYEKVLLYHMTDIHNIPQILNTKALIAYHNIQDYVSMAHQSVQTKRERIKIKYPPYGSLHDYVPFYFAPRSPMLYAIYKNNVDSYYGNQADVIYLVTNVAQVIRHKYSYVFTNGHAIRNYTEQFSDITKLKQAVDWSVMQAQYWQDPAKKNRRQAEFLIHNRFYIKHLLGFAVMNYEIYNLLKCQLLKNTPFQDMYVAVRSDWYF